MNHAGPVNSATLSVAALLAIAGCASGPVRAPEVPATLRAPVDQTPFLEARATGVQIYECTSRPEAPNAFTWSLQAPEATLADRWGRTIGRHFAGPSWELQDGSRVVGEVEARDPGPDPTAIPWLLLRAKSASGAGALSRTQSIQRVRTVGGAAPSVPCTQNQAHAVVRVPYSAAYYFYRAAR